MEVTLAAADAILARFPGLGVRMKQPDVYVGIEIGPGPGQHGGHVIAPGAAREADGHHRVDQVAKEHA